MAGIYSQGGSAGHRYAGWLSEVEAKNFTFGGKVFNGSPSAIYVGSNLVWGSDWLTVAAQKAIRGAFGQRDGTAVINATNAYLDGIAASDRDKATALAGFINEDPMMVCSLGLEVQGVTMPIRKLNSSDGAHINLNQVLSATDIISYKANGTFSIGGRLGGAGSAGTYTSHSASPYGIRYYTGSWTTLYGNTVQTEIYTCEWDFNTKKCNVKDKGVYNFNYNIVNVNQKIEFGDAGFVKFKIDNTNESRKRDMYPFICQARTADKVSTGVAQAAGTCGMIDLLTGIFYPNANSSGSFTIEYTLPDGTPWTPLNQHQ